MTERKLCPKCHGRGEYFFDDHCQGTWVECDMCKGFGVYPLTGQEYLQTCSTEQLAEVLADVALWIHPFMKQKNRFELLKKQFYEWLKQPHTKGDSE